MTFKSVLKEQDRKALCDYLLEYASDEILLNAAEDTKAVLINNRSRLESLAKYIGPANFMKPQAETKELPVVESTATVVESSTVEIPGSEIQRIRADIRETILRFVEGSHKSAEQVASALNCPVSKARDYLKLLCIRGEIEYLPKTDQYWIN